MKMSDNKYAVIAILFCATIAMSACPEAEPAPIGLPVEMVPVEGGSFQMGDTAGGGFGEGPVHTVTLTGFYMGKYEVTQAQFKAVMGEWRNRSFFKWENYPVENLSWYTAVEFCNALSEREGLTPCYTIDKTTDSDLGNSFPLDTQKWLVTWNTTANGYRLPTETEWEYAAKGGNGSPGNYKYSGSDTVGKVACYQGNTRGEKHCVVGTKSPNGLGLYDMSGNVEEWCWDWFGYYPSEAQNNPAGPSSGSSRVARGGSYGDVAVWVRSTVRVGKGPSDYSWGTGFRLARSVFNDEQ
jgi:formylglycine-generating enzyme required for sulfatase activity